MAKLFSKTALEVCEGQQWDVDFETRDDVTIPEHRTHPQHKTRVPLPSRGRRKQAPASADGLYELPGQTRATSTATTTDR
jgi:hypothetical protein